MEQLVARREPPASAHQRVAFSPIVSDRIRALALRAIEGAPVLTQGEIRELAQAVIDHNDYFAKV